MRVMSCLLASAMFLGALIADDAASLQENTLPLTPSQQMLELFIEPLGENLENKDNLDLNYLRTLIAYHQGIINAAQFLLKHSQHQRVRALANTTIKAQTAEILYFQSLLPSLMEQKKLYSPKEVTLFNNHLKASSKEIKESINELELDKNINRNFLLALVFHHQIALSFSQEILQYTQLEEIRTIAQDILQLYEQDLESFHTLFTALR